MINITISDLYCTKCSFHLTVPRKKSKKRNFGHLKCEWCPRCKDYVNFREVREEDFNLDYVKERTCF